MILHSVSLGFVAITLWALHSEGCPLARLVLGSWPKERSQSWKRAWARLGPYRENSGSGWSAGALAGSQGSSPTRKTEAEGLARQAQQGKPVADQRAWQTALQTGLESEAVRYPKD